MSILVIDRDNDYRIRAISKQITLHDTLPILGLCAVFLALGVLLLMMQTGTFAAIVGIGFGGLGVIFALSRAIPGFSKTVRIADSTGLDFRYFSGLGTVPWSAITGFSTGSASLPFLGETVLTANFREPGKFSAFARNGMPLGTIEGCRRLSLAPLQAALEELRRQTATAPVAFTPPPAPPKAAPGMKKHGALITQLLFAIVPFLAAMAYRQRYGLQALRNIHYPLLGFGILAVMLIYGWIWYRNRSRAGRK